MYAPKLTYVYEECSGGKKLSHGRYEPHSQGMGRNLLDTIAAEVKDFIICVLYLKNITFQ